MVVLMQDNPCGNAVKSFGMGCKIFIHKIKGHLFAAKYVFPYFRYAKAAFIVTPFIAIYFANMCVNKCAFKTGAVWI